MLLTNWLGTLTSHIKKRPLFRSRDRSAIRRCWQAAVNNQISTTEVLEDRTLLTTAAPFSVDDVTPADAGYTSYSFTVQYSAEDLGQTVQPSSIDVYDVTVTFPRC